MSIESGQQLLHYRIVEKIGEGGMGVVWKAIDTTLDRPVAIKVLPEVLTGSADRVARLEREAKLLGSLNHPNVATVHGLHVDPDNDGTRFLVMELVDGEDLSERLARGGAVPHAEAVEIARQIAEGLEAAHAAGVIHRDLKPANVKVNADGRVKVLDFGLARAFESDTTSGTGDISPTMSPTLTSAGTLTGTILGTASYMSPEQARGHPVDGRADVWAFGVVLYEMLSGRSAFRGETVSDTLASVLKLEPDLDALPDDIPRELRRLVTRCLQKNRKQRLHHIADARILLEETQAGVAEEPSVVAAPARPGERKAWIAALVLVGLAAAAVTWALRPASAPPPHRKLLLALDGEDPDDPDLNDHEISPDGARLAYRNGKKVFVRDLDDWASREITAAAGAGSLFWSPDGASLGFTRDKELWHVSPDGGAGEKICDLPGSVGGATWTGDGTIVMSGTVDGKAGLWAFPERGGEPHAVLLAEEKTHFHGAHALPDGRGLLATLHARPEMRVSVLADEKLTALFALKTNFYVEPMYSSTGHILYYRGGSNRGLWARPFSLDTLELTGERFLVAANSGGASVARDGTLVYTHADDPSKRRLVWVDRQGEILETIGSYQEGFATPSLSLDGGRLAVRDGEWGNDDQNIWIVDVARGTRTRLTSAERSESYPTWTPDGRRVLYVQHISEDVDHVMIVNADGTGEAQKLAESAWASLSPDGRYLITQVEGEKTGTDLWVSQLEGDGEARLLVGTAAHESRGRVSPDGAYIAYQSDESGRSEVYVKRFPSGEGKWQASVNGGSWPRFSPKGDELFWRNEGTLMAVDVETVPTLKLGTPRALFDWKPEEMLQFDVAPDARRFVLVAPEKEPEATPNEVMLVENWLAGL